MADADEARLRGAATQRERSQAAIIKAATTLFSERGWAETTMEDVAERAGVSPATTFNRFGSKQTLMGWVYRPLHEAVAQRALGIKAEQWSRWASSTGVLRSSILLSIVSPLDAALAYIDGVALLARSNQMLTTALLAAMYEQAVKVGPATEPDDVRVLVPLAVPLAMAIERGQLDGIFMSEVQALDLASYHLDGMMARMFTHPNETYEEMTRVAIDVALGSFAYKLPVPRFLDDLTDKRPAAMNRDDQSAVS